MKKILLFAAMLLSISAMAQQPVITFNETTHDVGKINEADGRVTTVFVFKTEGMILGTAAKMFTIAGPVIVYGVSASVVYGLIYWITTLF